MAIDVGSIEYSARLNTSRLRGDAAAADSIVKNTGDSVESTGKKSFSAFGRYAKVGLLAAGVATTALGVTAFKTGLDYNTLQQTSRAALTTILGSAQAANEQMDKLNEFVRTSPFGKDVFIKAQQQLLGFGVAAKDVIPALDAIQNAVAAVGGSADQITGITDVLSDIQSTGRVTGQEFQRLGFFGIDAAKLIGQQMGLTSEQIKEMASNPGGIPVATMWDPLVNGLQQNFGGAADNVKKTWSGTVDRIKAAFRDLGSAIAAPFVNPMGGGAGVAWGNKFADTLRSIQAGIPPLVEKIKGAMAIIVQAVAPVTTFIMNNKQAWEALKNIVIALIIIFAGLVVATVITVIAAFALLQVILNVVMKVIEVVIGVIIWFSNVLATGINWVIQLGNSIALVIGVFVRFGASVVAQVSRVIATIRSLASTILGAVARFGSLLISAGASLIQGLINGIRNMAGGLIGAISSVSGNIGKFFSGAANWLYDTGTAIIQGLINGIKGMAGAVGGAIADVATGAVNSAKSALGIESPSKVFMSIGKNISVGLAKGITSGGSSATRAMSGVISGLDPSLSSISGGSSLAAIDSAASSSGSSSTTINLNMSGIMTRSKADERDVAKSLVERLNEELRAKNVAQIGGGALA